MNLLIVKSTAGAVALADARTHRTPSVGQKRAGNYRKGKLGFHGLTVSIETPAGATRSGVSPDGHSWSVRLKYPYGYINRTAGADGDHVDCLIGPHPESQLVFVVDQHRVDGPAFDEHKVVLGCRNEAEARAVYASNWSSRRPPLSAITAMSMPRFKFWLRTGDMSAPLAGQVHEGMIKSVGLSKESVHYREGTRGKCCGNCSMFHQKPPELRKSAGADPDFVNGSCTLVDGIVHGGDVCDEWDAEKDVKAGPGRYMTRADLSKVTISKAYSDGPVSAVCADCGFENPNWDGDNAACPDCGGTMESSTMAKAIVVVRRAR